MNEKDLKEYHDLDKLKTYQPLPLGLMTLLSIYMLVTL